MTPESSGPAPEAPSNPELMAQARAFEAAGDWFEAGRCYQRVLDADPAHAEAHGRLGAIALRAEQPAAALACFAAALESEPTQAEAWIGYIDALFLAGQIDEARALFAQAREQGLDGEAADALADRIGLAPDERPEAFLKLFEAGRHADAIRRARHDSA